MTPKTKTATPRNELIDYLRGLSILAVLFRHTEPAQATLSLLSASSFAALCRNGHLGVSMFFVISGYLITSLSIKRYGGLADISLRNFYVFRVSRILPGMILLAGIVLILMSMGVNGFQGAGSLPVALWYIFTFRANHYFTEVGTYTQTWNLLWSLAIEEVFYLSYPLFCKALRARWLIVSALLTLVAYGPFHRWQVNGGLYDYFGCFDQLACGCLAAIFVSRFSISAKVARTFWLVGMAIVAIVYFGFNIHTSYVVAPSLIAVGTMLCLAGTYNAEFRGLAWDLFGTIVDQMGKYSYEIYLFHMVVLLLLYDWAPFLRFQQSLGVGDDVYFFAKIVPVTLVAVLLGKFILDPVRKYLRVSLSPQQALLSAEQTSPVTEPAISWDRQLFQRLMNASHLPERTFIRTGCALGLVFLAVALSRPLPAPVDYPVLREPRADSLISDPKVTFKWDAIPKAEDYWIDVGTEPSQGNIYAGFTKGATSAQVDLSAYLTGQRIYVQLYSKLPGRSMEPGRGSKYEFDTATLRVRTATKDVPSPQPNQSDAHAARPNPKLIQPPPGVALSGSLVTFQWELVPGAEDYWLDVGTQPAHGDIWAGLSRGADNMSISIPARLAGQTVYVQLFSKFPGEKLEPGSGAKYEFKMAPARSPRP